MHKVIIARTKDGWFAAVYSGDDGRPLHQFKVRVEDQGLTNATANLGLAVVKARDYCGGPFALDLVY